MKQMNIRIAILRLVATFVVAMLVYNLFHIQIIEGQKWADDADNNRFRQLIITAPRGRIFSADGVELAGSVPGYEVALAYEQDAAKREQTVTKLSELLKIEAEDITEKLSKHRRSFEPAVIATSVDFETVLLLEEHRHLMPGLVIQITPQRIYPNNTLLAHTLGRVDIDGIGTEGLEGYWNDNLDGDNGFSVIQVNASGRPVGLPVNSKQAVPGDDLILTIDAGLQQAAQNSLNRVLEKVRNDHDHEDAWGGAVVVTDPRTGKILAMVTEPSFDNNNKYSSSWDAHLPEEMPPSARIRTDKVLNYARTVGSTFKMLTGLAALQNNDVTGSELIHDAGATRIAGHRIVNYASRAYGNISMRRALEVSSNIYFATLGNRMGPQKIYDFIELFGMSTEYKNAGFDDIADGEQRSSLDIRDRPPWYGGHTLQISYGQLNEFTPMQMANYVSMLANGGVHFKPYMVGSIVDASGEIVELFEPEIIAQQDFDADKLLIIQEGMRDAAQGGQFRTLPFAIAGKTGTAEQVANRDPHAWWVGYAPYENPEISIVVFMEYGGIGLRASEVARDIIDYYFDLE